MNNPDKPAAEKTSENYSINEDWASVLAGAGVIFTVLFLFNSSSPSYTWQSGEELLGLLSNSENILRLLIQLILVFVFSSFAAGLIGKKILPFAGTFWESFS